jgi:hypothetical protein
MSCEMLEHLETVGGSEAQAWFGQTYLIQHFKSIILES